MMRQRSATDIQTKSKRKRFSMEQPGLELDWLIDETASLGPLRHSPLTTRGAKQPSGRDASRDALQSNWRTMLRY